MAHRFWHVVFSKLMSFISSFKCILIRECSLYNFHFSVFGPISSVILWNPGKFPSQLTYPSPHPNKNCSFCPSRFSTYFVFSASSKTLIFSSMGISSSWFSCTDAFYFCQKRSLCSVSHFLCCLGWYPREKGVRNFFTLVTGRHGHAVLLRTLGGHQFHTHASRHLIKPDLSAKPGQMEPFTVCSLLAQTNRINFPQLLLPKPVALHFPPYISPQLFTFWERSIWAESSEKVLGQRKVCAKGWR